MSRVGNVIPMREVPDTPAARASGQAAPAKAWAMLDLARAAGYAGARLTWCAGWGQTLREDPAKPPTAAGKPGRSAVDVVVASVVLRVPGLLWCAWEWPDGAPGWRPPSPRKPGKDDRRKVTTATAGQIRTGDGTVRPCTVAAAEQALRAAVRDGSGA